MDVVVVVPTYNESQNLHRFVSALLSLRSIELRVLVVDDSSPDGTGQIAEELAQENAGKVFVFHRAEKRGLGTAYLDGFRQALNMKPAAIAQMDADFSHPPEMLIKFLDVLESCDLVIGSRYIPGGSVDRNWPYWRKSLSAFGNFYARKILRVPIYDLTSGFKVWRRETISSMPLERVRSNGYAFQIEMTYLAYKLGFSVKEAPFYFPDREQGRSKMSINIQLEAAIRVWQLLIEYRNLSGNEIARKEEDLPNE